MTVPDEAKEKKKEYNKMYRLQNRERLLAMKAAYREKNNESIREYASKWRAENKEKRAQLDAAYYRANKPLIRAKERIYRAKNREKFNEKNLAYYYKNKDKYRTYWQNRRSSVRLCGGKLSSGLPGVLMVAQKGRCAVCRAPLKKTGKHLDHITPISKGGGNVDENIQLLCPPCNLKKSSKHPIEFMQENGYLL